jgi:hypothetical protein
LDTNFTKNLKFGNDDGVNNILVKFTDGHGTPSGYLVSKSFLQGNIKIFQQVFKNFKFYTNFKKIEIYNLILTLNINRVDLPKNIVRYLCGNLLNE